ncbi:MAG: ParB/RepB/Spo0J family partition protein [Oscillospiraceae bacterium]|nr:ParB/RepB/Spo0J family partition protein [Oscillospiraceae bacterium]
MKKFEKIDLGLKEAYNELFMNDEERIINRAPRVLDIEISQIDDFEGHPFKVKDDEEMEKLMESISTYGVLTPVIIREKDDGRYEMISGHRRKRACERLGLATVPAVVKELSREEAIIAMTDSNIQRENILPSEKAWSYKMKMDAIKKTAGRPKKNLTPMVSDLGTLIRTDELLGETNNESREQVRRYIRLTNLIPELLQMVDDGKIAFRPAVELSYLTEKEQHSLYETIVSEDCTPSLAQAIKFKELSRENQLDEETLAGTLSQPKANQKEKVTFRREELDKYFPKSTTENDIRNRILTLLEQDRKRKLNRDAR